MTLKKKIKTCVSTRAQIVKENKFQSYRAGWLDGARCTSMRQEFLKHDKRSMTKAYLDGYDAGRKAFRFFMAGARARLGLPPPSVLRAQ